VCDWGIFHLKKGTGKYAKTLISFISMSKILFIGDLNTYGRGYQRYRTLKEMGHDVVAYSHTFVSLPEKIKPPTLLYRIFWKLRFASR
jgi:hypothetical protein